MLVTSENVFIVKFSPGHEMKSSEVILGCQLAKINECNAYKHLCG